MAKLGQVLGMVAAACIAAAPAYATKDLSAKGPVSFSGGSSMTLFGTPHAIDNSSLDDLVKPHSGGQQPDTSLSAVPEPAAWLMMLFGFGVLGMATRRSTPHPLPPQHAL